MSMFFFVLCAAVGALAAQDASAALAQQVAAQAREIKALERRLSSSGSCSSDSDDPEPELKAFKIAEQQKRAQKRQDELLTLFTTTVGEPLSAVAISTHHMDKSIPKLIVGGGVSGSLHLYDKNGTLTLTLPPDAELPKPTAITAVVIGTKDDPFVCVGTAGGELLLYNLTLPRPAVGKRPERGVTSLTLAMRTEAQRDAAGAPIGVLTLDAYQRGRKTMLAVGDEAGAVRLLFRNGTERAAIAAGGAVHAMERGGANNAHLAVGAFGAGVALFDMGKPTQDPMICEGSEPPVDEPPAATKRRGGKSPPARPHIVSLTWDAQLPQLLYAATSDGVISIYNSKARTRQMTGEFKNISKMVTHCKIVTTVTGHDAAPLALAPVKGYLFSASPSLLVSHNISGLYARTRDEPNVMLGRSLSGGRAVMAGTRLGHFAVGAGALGELWLLQTKQAFRDPKDDHSPLGGMFEGGGDKGGMGNNLLRNPIVLGVVMMLVFWQSSKFWNKGGGGPGGPGGGRGGGGGGDRADFEDALRMMQGMKGGMGGMGGQADLSMPGGRGGGMGRSADFDAAFKTTFASGRGGRRDLDAGSRLEEIDK